MDAKSKIYKNSERRKYNITIAQRNEYRKISQDSRLAKIAAEKGIIEKVHEINNPKLFPELLMPQKEKNGLSCLSLFSGGGGLDLGFQLFPPIPQNNFQEFWDYLVYCLASLNI